MKILHLVGMEEDSGGVLSVLRNLQQVTEAKGWRHVVWVNRSYRERRRPALTYRYDRHICSDSPRHWTILYRALRALPGARRLLQQESFDVIHAHTRATLLVSIGLASWLDRMIVFTNHNYARRTGLYRWAARQRRLMTVLLTPNMARHYQLTAHPPRISVISACAGMDFYRAPLVENRPVTGQSTVRFVGLGNVVRWKNWHLVLQAMAALNPTERKRVRFDHWGLTSADPASAQYERELRQFILEQRMTGQAAFHGPTEESARCLRTADWFVLPSTNEPCSVALIEALALGLPALVSASGGNVDIVTPGRNGLLFQPGSEADLAVQMRRILAGQAPRGEPAGIRETVRTRSATCVAEQYAAVYQHLRSRKAAVSTDPMAQWIKR